MDPSNMNETAQAAVDAAVSIVSTWGLQVVGAVAVLIIGRMVAGAIRSSMTKGLRRANVDAALVPFFSNLIYYAVLAVVVIAVLNLFGIETTSLIAIVGAAGLAIGLALQGTLSNFAAGVMLLIFRPFKIGDYVEVGGSAGSVQEIGVFSTTLHTPDNVRVTIPNSAVYGETIKNYSANEHRRVDMEMGISYSDDIGKAIEVIRGVLERDPRVLRDPTLTVAVSELGDSSVNLVVRPWCRGSDYWDLRFDLTRTLKEELEAAGCSIPFPQRDIHVIDMPKAQAS
jgi:small conductance mechanosensitive channel